MQTQDSDILILIADPDQNILYASDDFLRTSGYTLEQLSGQNISIMHHPHLHDGPLKTQKLDLGAGQPWMGMLRYQCKNGSEWWLDTYIIPTMEGDKITELQYIFCHPGEALKSRAHEVYEVQRHGKTHKQLKRSSLAYGHKSTLLNLAILVPAFLWFILNTPSLETYMIAISTLLLSAVCNFLLSNRLQKLVSFSRNVVNSRPKQLVYTGHTDDIRQLELTIFMLQAQLDCVMRRILNSSSSVLHSSDHSAEVMRSTCQHIGEQQQDLAQIASAAEQMTATTIEMTEHSRQALLHVEKVQQDANRGTQIVNQATNAIRDLDKAIDNIGSNLNLLVASTSRIDKVIEVIQDIAEKTNLLALNAAIEAARAGENGRGFAVVADEVRQLAQRTRLSTNEINDIINGIQTETNSIAGSMKEGRKIADDAVSSIEVAGNSLLSIIQAVDAISDMTLQFASATEQQNQATQEVDIRIHAVSDAVTHVAGQAQETLKMNMHTATLAKRQSHMVERLSSA